MPVIKSFNIYLFCGEYLDFRIKSREVELQQSAIFVNNLVEALCLELF